MLVQARLLFATAAALVAGATFTAYRNDGVWQALLLGCATVALAVLACLPAAGLTSVGGSPWSELGSGRAERVRRVLLTLAFAVLTVGGVVDAVQGDPQTALIVAGVAAGALASRRAAASRGDGDPEVDGASGLPAQQRPVHQRDEGAVE